MADLEPRAFALLKKILQEHIPGQTVWMFGSRVEGHAHRASDIDLAIIHDQPLPTDVLSNLRYALEESDLPYRVDLVEWATTHPTFRQIIQKSHLIVQESSPHAPL